MHLHTNTFAQRFVCVCVCVCMCAVVCFHKGHPFVLCQDVHLLTTSSTGHDNVAGGASTSCQCDRKSLRQGLLHTQINHNIYARSAAHTTSSALVLTKFSSNSSMLTKLSNYLAPNSVSTAHVDSSKNIAQTLGVPPTNAPCPSLTLSPLFLTM